MFLPSVMEKSEKMPTRHSVIPRSTDLYDGMFNDQEVYFTSILLTGSPAHKMQWLIIGQYR